MVSFTDIVGGVCGVVVGLWGCVGAVAQLGEHLLCKQGVRGSNPLSSTIFCPKRVIFCKKYTR